MPPLQDRSPGVLCLGLAEAKLVRGTFLRIADVRSQPANISVAASRSTPSRRVVPSHKLPDPHPATARTPTITDHALGRDLSPHPKPCRQPGKRSP